MQGEGPPSAPQPQARTRRAAMPLALVDMGDRRGDGDQLRPVRRLLSDGRSNHKQRLGLDLHKGFVPVNLSLAPNRTSGYNVCPCATPGCIRGCLFHSGHGNEPGTRLARIARTRFLFQDRARFLEILHAELAGWEAYARRCGKRPAVRLNTFSDLNWAKIDPTIFTGHPDIQYYDSVLSG